MSFNVSEIIISPAQAQGLREPKALEHRLTLLKELTGEKWESKFDDDLRLTLRPQRTENLETKSNETVT